MLCNAVIQTKIKGFKREGIRSKFQHAPASNQNLLDAARCAWVGCDLKACAHCTAKGAVCGFQRSTCVEEAQAMAWASLFLVRNSVK